MKHIILVFILFTVDSTKLPKFLRKCKKNDADAKCVLEDIMTVFSVLRNESTVGKEHYFGLQTISPFHVLKINAQASPTLRVDIRDADMYGMETFRITDGRIDDRELTLRGHMDLLTVVGHYAILGTILGVPIIGKGTCNLSISDFDYTYKAKLFIEERKGKKYYNVKANENTVGKLENIGGGHWELNNLFNGKRRLGDAMNSLLNQNWKAVTNEMTNGIEKTFAFSIFNYYINGYFHFIPIDELFEK